jgi:hypothetical protein
MGLAHNEFIHRLLYISSMLSPFFRNHFDLQLLHQLFEKRMQVQHLEVRLRFENRRHRENKFSPQVHTVSCTSCCSALMMFCNGFSQKSTLSSLESCMADMSYEELVWVARMTVFVLTTPRRSSRARVLVFGWFSINKLVNFCSSSLLMKMASLLAYFYKKNCWLHLSGTRGLG